jgi:hypothetical protein
MEAFCSFEVLMEAKEEKYAAIPFFFARTFWAIFFSCIMFQCFIIKYLGPRIRIRIKQKRLDPDPDSMNLYPRHLSVDAHRDTRLSAVFLSHPSLEIETGFKKLLKKFQ